jgi:RNA polymerase sigma-70 factor (ECF subfamily)
VRGVTIDETWIARDQLAAETEEELFTRLYPALRRFAAVAGATDVEPDDLVQEAVARALRIRPLTELDEPLAYLRRAILNVARNRRRGLARGRRVLNRLRPNESTTAEYGSDLSDLDRLSPNARAVLFLVEVEGWTFAATARQIGITEEAARATASRARRRLRAELSEEEP